MTKKVKFLLYVPLLVMEHILYVVFGYIPWLNIRYMELSAKIDNDKSLSKFELKKLKDEHPISYIKNKKLRDMLWLTGSLNEWQVFSVSDKTTEGRDIIYLTKQRLRNGDILCGERLPDYYLSSAYSNDKLKRTLYNKGVDNIGELEPQIYVIVSKFGKEHDIMDKERVLRYKKNSDNKLKKCVIKAIKKDRVLGRMSMSDFTPVFHYVVKQDRIDLIKMILDSALDDTDRKNIVNYTCNIDGLFDKNGVSPISLAKSDEMKELLSKYIKNPVV